MNRYQIKVLLNEKDNAVNLHAIDWESENLDEAVEEAIELYENGALEVEVKTIMGEELVYSISMDENDEEYIQDNRHNYI